MMRKFRFGKFTSGKYEVNLRKFERMGNLQLLDLVSQWQEVARWQFGREQRREPRTRIHTSQHRKVSE
jgi:hypothetical protein